jgi:hypothetical protein
MYAHQVIESICESQYANNKDNELKSFFAEIKNMMMAAQQFHLGEIDKQDVLKSYTGKELFHRHSKDGLGLPYQTVWVDWKQNIDVPYVDFEKKIAFPKKEGALIKSEDRHNYLIFGFSYYTRQMRYLIPKDRWVVFPVWWQLTYSQDYDQFFGVPCWISSLEKEYGSETLLSVARELDRNVTAVAMLLDFLNCKNISTIDNPPPEKLNKKRIKNGKQPLFTYKTLVIKPTGKKQSQHEAQGLWENRVHLCRGHFKEYTEDNPLFGKFTGRYWWQPSVRGNKAKGVVMKDYKVELEGAA